MGYKIVIRGTKALEEAFKAAADLEELGKPQMLLQLMVEHRDRKMTDEVILEGIRKRKTIFLEKMDKAGEINVRTN